MSEIRIDHRVRVRTGMHVGAVGDVVEIHPAAPQPYAVIESRGERIAAFLGVLDVLGESPVSASRERDELLAIIHRDGGHYVGEHGVTKAVADAHATWAAVVSERDRMREGVEALREYVHASWDDECPTGWLTARLDAILAGGES